MVKKGHKISQSQKKWLFILLVGSFLVGCLISLPIYIGFKPTVSQAFGYLVLTMFISYNLGIIFFSHKISTGAFQEILFTLCCGAMISFFLGFLIFASYKSRFQFNNFDWIGALEALFKWDWIFLGIQFAVFVAFMGIYLGFINRDIWRMFRGGFLRGKGKLKEVDANLENSRWMNEKEKKSVFRPVKYSELGETPKDGVPVMATLSNNGKDIDILFNSPCHSIIIGSTGSGKTTTFVNPMIQLLGASKAGSSMIMTDPKGELFSLHSGFLASRGYDVKVIDLRDTYSSYRWNPLDSIWDHYQEYANAQHNVFLHRDSINDNDIPLADSKESFVEGKEWYVFENKAYSSMENLKTAIKVYKKRTFDEVYEDLNDLVSALVPVENEKDPMWEKGARAITLAVLLAMLEDSENKKLGMVKEKFNFFNLAKILQNSNQDYKELRSYFKGRSPLSKALSLSKQVCDAAESTRASYMSIVYEKLTMFNDSGICALTSASDFVPENLADRPTALFLKIPDEKDTRYNLAAIFMLSIYKALIKIASTYEDLSLPRSVYYIMDEFANMPKIDKFDKMITVGRSRKIWFNMIIQSYAQLNNVYGDKVADIVKGNCGIKMFIGSNDMGTCKEYSELCGNITVATNSTSGSATSSKDYNISTQMQVRPLIYPSELQRLNKPGDIGHSIVVTFGNYPLMTYFTPSFKVPLYKMGKMDTSELNNRLFDEKEAFYDISIRNRMIEEMIEEKKNKGGITELKLNTNVDNNSNSTNNAIASQTADKKPQATENNIATALNTKPENVKQNVQEENNDTDSTDDTTDTTSGGVSTEVMSSEEKEQIIQEEKQNKEEKLENNEDGVAEEASNDAERMWKLYQEIQNPDVKIDDLASETVSKEQKAVNA